MKQLVFIEESPVSGREHSVQPGTTVGRADCDINLPDPDVSRRHAIVREAGGALAIEDLGSTNGTYVDGQRISEVTEIGEGATVRFGNTVWRLQTPADATRIAMPAATRATDATSEGDGAPQTAQQAVAQVPAPASAPPPTPAAPAPQPPAGGPDGRRGDVPAPDHVPSVIRPVLPPAGEPAPFSAAAPSRTRGSAARRLEATIVCFGVVLATAVAVAAYFIER